MKRIRLTQGKYAIVDDEDYDFLKRLEPVAMERDGIWETVVNIMGINTRSHFAYLHHFLKKPRHNQAVIHRNGDKLDLRKNNLIIASQSACRHRGKKSKGKSSIYKGVSWNKREGMWHAYINNIKSKRIQIGYFEIEKEAAIAYNEKARELYGKLAYQNKLNLCQKK